MGHMVTYTIAGAANEVDPKWTRSGPEPLHFGPLLDQGWFGPVRSGSVSGLVGEEREPSCEVVIGNGSLFLSALCVQASERLAGS